MHLQLNMLAERWTDGDMDNWWMDASKDLVVVLEFDDPPVLTSLLALYSFATPSFLLSCLLVDSTSYSLILGIIIEYSSL